MYLTYGILICRIRYAVYFDRQTLRFTHICMYMRRYMNKRYIYGLLMYLTYGILICRIHYAVYFDRQSLCYTHICMHMRRYMNNRYIGT